MIPSYVGKELQKVIKEAGHLLLLYWNKKNLVIRKKGDKSLVTEADFASERFLLEELHKIFPPADFITEESGHIGSQQSGYHWVIDPLDGTRNFALHIPYFCISVALTYKDKPVLGAIYNPIVDEFFYAEAGQGAFCNGEKIAIATPASFEESVIAFGLLSTPQYRDALIKAIQKLAGTVAAARNMGAAALDMAQIAKGRFHGCIYAAISWWDVAAGMLIVEEAGGKVGQVDGKPVGPQSRSCIAGSPLIFDTLPSLFENK